MSSHNNVNETFRVTYTPSASDERQRIALRSSPSAAVANSIVNSSWAGFLETSEGMRYKQRMEHEKFIDDNAEKVTFGRNLTDEERSSKEYRYYLNWSKMNFRTTGKFLTRDYMAKQQQISREYRADQASAMIQAARNHANDFLWSHNNPLRVAADYATFEIGLSALAKAGKLAKSSLSGYHSGQIAFPNPMSSKIIPNPPPRGNSRIPVVNAPKPDIPASFKPPVDTSVTVPPKVDPTPPKGTVNRPVLRVPDAGGKPMSTSGTEIPGNAKPTVEPTPGAPAPNPAKPTVKPTPDAPAPNPAKPTVKPSTGTSPGTKESLGFVYDYVRRPLEFVHFRLPYYAGKYAKRSVESVMDNGLRGSVSSLADTAKGVYRSAADRIGSIGSNARQIRLKSVERRLSVAQKALDDIPKSPDLSGITTAEERKAAIFQHSKRLHDARAEVDKLTNTRDRLSSSPADPKGTGGPSPDSGAVDTRAVPYKKFNSYKKDVRRALKEDIGYDNTFEAVVSDMNRNFTTNHPWLSRILAASEAGAVTGEAVWLKNKMFGVPEVETDVGEKALEEVKTKLNDAWGNVEALIPANPADLDQNTLRRIIRAGSDVLASAEYSYGNISDNDTYNNLIGGENTRMTNIVKRVSGTMAYKDAISKESRETWATARGDQYGIMSRKPNGRTSETRRALSTAMSYDDDTYLKAWAIDAYPTSGLYLEQRVPKK